jgi:hypothetical protein
MYIYNAHVNAAEALYLCCKFTFEYKIHAQKLALDCGYRSVVEHLPNMYEALGSIPNTAKGKTKRTWYRV